MFNIEAWLATLFKRLDHISVMLDIATRLGRLPGFENPNSFLEVPYAYKYKVSQKNVCTL
jgi:hypothetical protein